ncbi:hypothetical protein GCK72_020134 [Caenorhabditis remanei]|uniref:Uncharacterized protein n=1 Tax=Caenorhabditis remanei TaxID=31234 RepID=A0A6A5GEA5_CAERE|nr:hypothetical protein GCK72_020134 [Caenorhabditis remanei]KAF1753577.1 hypothetical protein GCK72_020134 [Caenorhabditis remanei]
MTSQWFRQNIFASAPEKREESLKKIQEIIKRKMKDDLNRKVEEIPEVSPDWSPELQEKIGAMYKSLKPHKDVYPYTPMEGDLAIPTGGLAKCRCSKECDKVLPQPEYHVISQTEEDKRWFTELDYPLVTIPVKTLEGPDIEVRLRFNEKTQERTEFANFAK